MPLSLAFPIAKADPSPAERQQMAGWLQPDHQPFSARHVAHRVGVDSTPGTPAWARELFAIWDGDAQLQTDGRVTIQLDVGKRLELGKAFPYNTPVPTRVSLGPLVATGLSASVSTRVGRGDVLGTLSGEHLEIAFQDQHYYWLDPVWSICVLDLLGLWPFGGVHDNPLIQAPATPPTLENLFNDFAFAGPLIPEDGAHWMCVSNLGQERRVSAHNPPYAVDSASHQSSLYPPIAALPYLSFLTRDPIRIQIVNAAMDAQVALTVEDLERTGSVTLRSENLNTSTASPVFEITIDQDMPPDHPAYDDRPYEGGSDAKTASLGYDIKVSHAALNQPLSIHRVELRQDELDIIRQEYLWHGPPYQGGASPLPVPPRYRFERPDDAPSSDQAWFAAQSLGGLSPYYDQWILNATGLQRTAEYIRRRYYYHLLEADPLAAQLLTYTTADLSLAGKTGWLNPQMNEYFGTPRDSLLQYGLMLGLSPVNRYEKGRKYVCLGRAAGDFLQRLYQDNPGVSFTELVACLFTGDSQHVWTWTMTSAGVTSEAGPDYAAAIGGPPEIETAAFQSYEMIVRWRPTDLNARLAYPEADAYPATEFDSGMVNLVLVAREHARVPPPEQLAITHAAETIRQWYESNDSDETRLLYVDNPVQLLQQLGAFRGTRKRIKHLYTLSHGYPGYLVLLNPVTNAPGDPSWDEDDDPLKWLVENPVHDPSADPDSALGDDSVVVDDDDVREWMRELFGPNLFEFYDGDLMTPQSTRTLHTYDIQSLPSELRRRVRETFDGNQGIFILGCVSQANFGADSTFADAFARLTGQRVWGTQQLGGVYRRNNDPGRAWDGNHGKRRADAWDGHTTAIITGTQGALAGAHLPKDILRKWLDPARPFVPHEFYSDTLTPRDPDK